MTKHGPTWVMFTRRTEDPKLAFIERVLTSRGIPNRRSGKSFRAPILEVHEDRLEDADKLLGEDYFGDGRRFDDIEDDDPVFDGEPAYEDDDDYDERARREAREKLDRAFGPHMGLNADWSVRAWYVAGEGEENRNPDRPDIPAALYTHHGIWIIETEDDQYCVLERTHVDDDDDTDNIEEEFCAPPEGIEAVIAQARFTAMRQIPGYQMPSNKPPRDENPRARWRP